MDKQNHKGHEKEKKKRRFKKMIIIFSRSLQNAAKVLLLPGQVRDRNRQNTAFRWILQRKETHVITKFDFGILLGFDFSTIKETIHKHL